MMGDMVGAGGCDGSGNAVGKFFDRMGQASQPRGPRMAPQHPGEADMDLLPSHNWDMDFASPMMAPPGPQMGWQREFQQFQPTAASSSTAPFPQSAASAGPMGMGPRMGGMSFMPPPMTFGNMAQPAPQHQQQPKVVEDIPIETQTFSIEGQPEESYAEKKDKSEFFSFVEKVKQGEIQLRGKEMFTRRPDGTWPEEMLEHEEEEGPHMLRTVEESALEGPKGEEETEQWLRRLEDAMHEYDGGATDEWSRDILQGLSQPLGQEYQLEEDNAYEHLQNPFEEGLRLLEAGNLQEAILCFEAAVKQDANHVAAWQYLGTTQAENERDRQAVMALEKCLALDPNNLVALMAISVSYTNERWHVQSLNSLEKWLKVNPKYSAVAIEDTEATTEPAETKYDMFFMHPAMHQKVVRMYKKALELHGEDQDANLHKALGVMMHMANDFDQAVSWFQQALAIRPEDARLWNKLGATLANSDRSEDAIVAYNRALDLHPGLVRAQYNLGISYNALHQYHDAATHFLRAIAMQQGCLPEGGTGPGGNSDEMWGAVRTAFTLMNRMDLVQKTHSREVRAFADEFDLML